MGAFNAYIWLSTIIFMFLILCLAVYSYSFRLQKVTRRGRSSSVFTVAQCYDSDQTRQPHTVYSNPRTDLPPSYDQVVIGINIAPATIPVSERTHVVSIPASERAQVQ